MTYKVFIALYFLSICTTAMSSHIARNGTNQNTVKVSQTSEGLNLRSSKPSRRKKSKRLRRKSNQSSYSDASSRKTKRRKAFKNSTFAVQASAGYASPYGMVAASGHYTPFRFLDINAALGYGASGIYLGAGSQFLFYLSRSFGLCAGGMLSYTGGGNSEVSVGAKFTPEGSSTSEDVEISKPYTISATVLGGVSAGGFIKLGRSIGIFLNGTYSLAISGNEVTLGDEIYYEEDIEVSNEDQIISELNEKAEENAKVGGLGANIGLRLSF